MDFFCRLAHAGKGHPRYEAPADVLGHAPAVLVRPAFEFRLGQAGVDHANRPVRLLSRKPVAEQRAPVLQSRDPGIADYLGIGREARSSFPLSPHWADR